jgi:hypothetical protein
MALRMTAVNNSKPPGKGTGAARLLAARGEISGNRAVVRRVAGRDEDSAGRMLER